MVCSYLSSPVRVQILVPIILRIISVLIGINVINSRHVLINKYNKLIGAGADGIFMPRVEISIRTGHTFWTKIRGNGQL